MKKLLEKIALPTCVFVLLATLGILFVMFIHLIVTHNPNEPYRTGQEAYQAGIEASANPFIGRGYTSARQWYDGYLDAKRESEGVK